MEKAGRAVALFAAVMLLAAAGCAPSAVEREIKRLYGDDLRDIEAVSADGGSMQTTRIRVSDTEITDAQACSILAVAAPEVSKDETVSVSFVVAMDDGTGRLIDYEWSAASQTLLLLSGRVEHPDAETSTVYLTASATGIQLKDLSEIASGTRAISWSPSEPTPESFAP